MWRCCEDLSQRCGRFVKGLFALVEQGWHAKKAVDHAIVAAVLRWHSGGLEALSIGLPLIAQRVHFGGNDQRWWEAG
jgi:hypothetical protein